MTEYASKRDRIRKLVFEPLGFRAPKGTSADTERAQLDTIADDLAYLGDADLEVLVRMVRVHGEGAAKCFWPSRATFAGFAHVVRPRPLSDDPALRRWWASVEGQRMVVEGTLVETYQYFEKHRSPPVRDGARSQVLAAARDNARRLQLIEERERLGYPLQVEDLSWRKWYLERRTDLEALLRSVKTDGQRVSA